MSVSSTKQLMIVFLDVFTNLKGRSIIVMTNYEIKPHVISNKVYVSVWRERVNEVESSDARSALKKDNQTDRNWLL